MKSVEDYHKGYIDGMSVNHKYPQLLMVAGYSFDQILKLVLKDQDKMTRKEAISKCHGISNPECLVQALEALGLLKFEQEKPKPQYLPIGFKFPYNKYEEWSECVQALSEQGYQIVHK